jgi:hypothetical protein
MILNTVARLLGNDTNNLWVLVFTLDLFEIRHAELLLIITLSTMRNYKNNNTPKVSLLFCSSYFFFNRQQSGCICRLSCSSNSSSPTQRTRFPALRFVSLPRKDYLLLREYVSLQPLTSNGRWSLRNASNNRLPRNWLLSCNCLNNSLPRKWRFSMRRVQLSR